MRLGPIGFLVLGAGWMFQLQAKPLDDREATAKLIGTWMIRPDDHGLIMGNGIYIFRRDGTYTARGSVKVRDHYIDVEGQGNWRIANGVLFQDVTKSSLPEVVPIGRTYHDVLLGITDENCWIREEGGTEHIWNRYKP